MGGRQGKAPRARPEAVLLDAFGTLLELEPPGPRLRAELRERTGVDVGEEAAEDAFRAEIGHYLAHHLEGRDAVSLAALRDDCAEVVRVSLGLGEADRGPVRAAMLASIRFSAFADAAPALAELRARGIRLAVASNWDCSLGETLGRAGLAGAVDAVVSSAEAGAAKPDLRPFATALAAVGARADRAVHVGDSVAHDVEGARAAGLEAVLIRRGAPVAAPPAVPVIASLAELPGLLFDPG